MYSPKIPEKFIPALYRLGRSKGIPMTKLVADAVELYLENEGVLDANERQHHARHVKMEKAA
ncbi:MAG TPA: hypothetical protein VNN21_04050 [Dehalococcoidia bacterium]|nr:hypothetical protein [Dehalococcoidia bacterium]